LGELRCALKYYGRGLLKFLPVQLSDIGLELQPSWKKHFVIGAGMALLLSMGIFLAGVIARWVRITESGSFLSLTLIGGIISCLMGAFSQELVFRGVLLQFFKEQMGYTIKKAVVVSSLFYGLIHITDPNITLPAIIAMAEQGLFLWVLLQ